MLSPLLLLIALSIILDNGRPIFFIQERAGLYGKPFIIYKFRTMLNSSLPTTMEDFKSEANRITRLGRFLRSTGFDELPQLVNVLKGDMSLVGPRPTLIYQVEKYNSRQRRRLDAPPGITGWAQVNGGEILPWEKRIEMDIWYIQNHSLTLDLKILIMTLWVAIKKREAWVEQSQDSIVQLPGSEKVTEGGMLLKKLIIIGAGGHGREVLQLALDQNKEEQKWDIKGFVDDNPELQGRSVNGFPVLGDINWLFTQPGDMYTIIALGEPNIKRDIESRLDGSNIHFATLIHPTAIISDSVEIREGTIITAGVILTVNIKIGKHVVVNLNSSVSHDAVIGDYVTLAPNAKIMGAVTIGSGCYVGSGATVREGVTVGENSIIGLGAVIVKDLPGNIVAVGCPAEIVRENITGRIFK